MPCFCHCTCLFHLDWCIDATDYEIIHIQLGCTHIKRCRTKCCNIIFKSRKLQRNLIRILHETFQLLCNGLRCCDIIRFLSTVCYHLIYNLIQTFGFQIHSFYYFRINLLNIIISVFVRLHTCINQQFTVNLVQSVYGIFQFFQNGTHTSKCCFKS